MQHTAAPPGDGASNPRHLEHVTVRVRAGGGARTRGDGRPGRAGGARWDGTSSRSTWWRGLAVAVLVALCAGTADAASRDQLVWRADHRQFDADVESWPLARVLATLASATGWRVYVAPDLEHAVTARFERLDTSEALRRLLGALNFALLPQPDGSTALFVFRRSMGEATRAVATATAASARPGTPIADEVVVVLKPGARESIDALARRFGARIVGRIDGLRAYRLDFADASEASDARRRLASDPDVASVESNIAIAPPATLAAGADARTPDLSFRADASPSRNGVVVGLIDSAVQSQGSRIASFVQPGVSVVGDYLEPTGAPTHGTAMAETILDGVQQALREAGRADATVRLSILPVDVYGGNELTNSFDVAQGLVVALDRHANIVNLSLGGAEESPLLRDLIADAARQGVIFVAAAGNDPVTAPFYPAADREVLSVTAADDRGAVASYANRGAWIDALAPGSNLVTYQGQAWEGSGTSFASSWVSGWAAGTMASGVRRPGVVESRTLERWRMPRDAGR